MGKRGASQIDWIISLSLFLIYIGWFFIFIRPSINLGTTKESLITILKNNFEDDNNWELKKYPLFIEFNSTGKRMPVMMDYEDNITDIYFTDGEPFLFWNGKLIFVANMSEGMNTFWIIEGTGQTSSQLFEGINTEEDRVAIENLSVYFDDSMPDTLVYKGTELVESMSYSINDEDFSQTNASFDNEGFAAFFTAKNGNLNHTSIIFAYSASINNFISLEQNGSYLLSIDSDLYDFDSYYSDNSNFGDFEYTTSPQDMNYSYDYVTLTGSRGSMSMFFDNYVNFNFTYYNSTLRVKINMPVYDNYNYRIDFSDGNYTEAKRNMYSAEFGAAYYLKGINLNNITTNYTYKKSLWGFPNDRDFQILIYDNSTAFHYLQPDPIYEIGEFSGNNKRVYAEAADASALDEDGNYQTISILYKLW